MIQAAIDLGTVTSRLMIGEVRQGKVNILERALVITDLGEGLTTSGVISDAAYARLLGALLQFKEIISDVKTDLICEGRTFDEIPIKTVATSALRDAANAAEILTDLSEYGFDIEIITGGREAELSFKGTLSGFTDLRDPVISIDVGGGSTELIYGTAESQIGVSHSFDIGSRRVTEMFLKGDPPTSAEILAARLWVEEQVSDFISSLPETPSEVIAVAGTATSAITIRDGIRDYTSALVHGKRITADEIGVIINTLSLMTLEKRRNVVGLHPGRAPVILGGLVTLAVIQDIIGEESLLVSDTDILQGIILDEASIC